jgi:ABC-2 type transport system ATP-binding protein
MNAITITNLSKTYTIKSGKRHSVQGINITIPQGTVFGFLGPNGAGKTTTMKMLVGLTKPTHGHITIGDLPPQHIDTKRIIGFMPETPSFYLYLTGYEFLDFVADIFSLGAKQEVIDRLLRDVDLYHANDLYIKSYSKGMLQRLGLAQALVNDPDVLFLDEPLDGLDPLGRAHIKKIILELKSRGKTVFFNSHILSDVEEICDLVAIIDNGKIIATGSPNTITGTHKDLEDAFVHLITNNRAEKHHA